MILKNTLYLLGNAYGTRAGAHSVTGWNDVEGIDYWALYELNPQLDTYYCLYNTMYTHDVPYIVEHIDSFNTRDFSWSVLTKEEVEEFLFLKYL